MKKQNAGIALLLLGLIIAQYQELAAWMSGLMLGIAGLCVVLFSSRED